MPGAVLAVLAESYAEIDRVVNEMIDLDLWCLVKGTKYFSESAQNLTQNKTFDSTIAKYHERFTDLYSKIRSYLSRDNFFAEFFFAAAKFTENKQFCKSIQLTFPWTFPRERYLREQESNNLSMDNGRMGMQTAAEHAAAE